MEKELKMIKSLSDFLQKMYLTVSYKTFLESHTSFEKIEVKFIEVKISVREDANK